MSAARRGGRDLPLDDNRIPDAPQPFCAKPTGQLARLVATHDYINRGISRVAHNASTANGRTSIRWACCGEVTAVSEPSFG
jgi:hypothetical protein